MRHLAFLCALLLAPSSEVRAAPLPQSPGCGPASNPNYVMYNRVAFAHIGEQGGMYSCHPLPVAPGIIALDSAEKKASYRFTLSSSLNGSQNANGIWIYYRTIGAQRQYEVSLRSDSNGRPGQSLGRTKFSTHFLPGTTGWQYVSFRAFQPLQPGLVYHVRISPSAGTTVDPSNCMHLITARSKCPLPYLPTDGTGTAAKSPFDPALAVMLSPGAPNVSDFLVQGDFAVGLSPIFALDLGASGLVGQPYDAHVEPTISRRNQYGQAVVVTSTQTVNYAAFFLRGMGCPPSEGCPDTNPNCTSADLPRPFGALKLVISSPTNPQFQNVVKEVLPANYNAPLYLKRSHWWGVTLNDVVLTPGTYHFMLKSSDSFGIDPVQDHDGWTFSFEGSTLPGLASAIPTYQRDTSYAIKSSDSGATVQPFDNGFAPGAKKWDAPFILGYFPGGLNTPLAILDDAVVVAHCSGAYASTVPLGTRVFFNETNRNIGAVPAVGPNRIFLRLLDMNCNVLNGPADGGAGMVIHPNQERNNQPGSLSIRTGFHGTTDAFVWLEVGHFEGTTMVRDDLIPWEIRVGPCP